MLQLTYISTATRDVAGSDVAAILVSSRRRNVTSNVTGLLLYDGKRFLQALEGESMAVERTYQLIKADPRHRSLVLLSSKIVADRAFGEVDGRATRRGRGGRRHTSVGRSTDR